MDSVIRGLVVYLFLFVVFRVAGKRTLAEMSSFDLVLLLIISETTQQAMIANDHSITNSFLLIVTLVSATIALSWIRERSRVAEKWLDDVPLIIMENGRLHRERMLKLRVDETDIMASARKMWGLERLDEVKYAIVESNGEITVIPKKGERRKQPNVQ
jgi:uncharacterized membrane protein YcaP (DUF421 family)